MLRSGVSCGSIHRILVRVVDVRVGAFSLICDTTRTAGNSYKAARHGGASLCWFRSEAVVRQFHVPEIYLGIKKFSLTSPRS